MPYAVAMPENIISRFHWYRDRYAMLIDTPFTPGHVESTIRRLHQPDLHPHSTLQLLIADAAIPHGSFTAIYRNPFLGQPDSAQILTIWTTTPRQP